MRSCCRVLRMAIVEPKIRKALILAAFLISIPKSAAEAPVPIQADVAPSSRSLTLRASIELAQTHFPQILQQQAELRAAKNTVTAQTVKEYMPTALLSYQDVVASHNRLTQTLFSSAALPTTPGPGPETIQMRGRAFSAAGFLIEWDPIDFGLHKAKIDLTKAELKLSAANYGLTLLDISVDAASRFLDALIMREQVTVAQANVDRFADFSKIVHAQVRAGLKPVADATLADSQLANANNDLIRARLNYQLAQASLSYIVGAGGQLAEIDPGGMIIVTTPDIPQRSTPMFELHPLARARQAAVFTQQAEMTILAKEYYPRLRWLGGMNLRGTTFMTNRGDVQAPDISGIFPTVPNWNVGMMIDFPLFDIVRIQTQKRVVNERVAAARHGYDLAIQQLKMQDTQAQSRVRAALDLAANMPVQVLAAEMAARQAQARYRAGMTTVAQVAEANQILADSRVKGAVANVGVWKALLTVAAVHGDIQPFVAAADKATRRETH